MGVEGPRNDDSRLICACRKDDFSSELSRSGIFGDRFRNKQISFLLNNKTFFRNFDMARRRKTRTHLKGANAREARSDGTPKSFIIKHGQVGSSLTQLVRDMRKVMEPNTASRLKVRKGRVNINPSQYTQVVNVGAT